MTEGKATHHRCWSRRSASEEGSDSRSLELDECNSRLQLEGSERFRR